MLRTASQLLTSETCYLAASSISPYTRVCTDITVREHSIRFTQFELALARHLGTLWRPITRGLGVIPCYRDVIPLSTVQSICFYWAIRIKTRMGILSRSYHSRSYQRCASSWWVVLNGLSAQGIILIIHTTERIQQTLSAEVGLH